VSQDLAYITMITLLDFLIVLRVGQVDVGRIGIRSTLKALSCRVGKYSCNQIGLYVKVGRSYATEFPAYLLADNTGALPAVVEVDAPVGKQMASDGPRNP